MKAAAQNLLGNMAIGGDVTGSMKELVSTASTFLLDNAIPMVGRVITSLPEAIQTRTADCRTQNQEPGRWDRQEPAGWHR